MDRAPGSGYPIALSPKDLAFPIVAIMFLVFLLDHLIFFWVFACLAPSFQITTMRLKLLVPNEFRKGILRGM